MLWVFAAAALIGAVCLRKFRPEMALSGSDGIGTIGIFFGVLGLKELLKGLLRIRLVGLDAQAVTFVHGPRGWKQVVSVPRTQLTPQLIRQHGRFSADCGVLRLGVCGSESGILLVKGDGYSTMNAD